MKIEKIEINKLKKNLKNPRANVTDVNELMGSMEEQGLINPIIIDENNYILAGHRRLECAKRLGWKTIDTIRQKNLSEFNKSAMLVASNSTQKPFGAWENMEAINDFYWNEFCEEYQFKNTADKGYSEFAKIMGISSATVGSIIKSFEGKNKQLAKKMKNAGIEVDTAKAVLTTTKSIREDLVNDIIEERKKFKKRLPTRGYLREFISQRKKEMLMKEQEKIHPSLIQSLNFKITAMNNLLMDDIIPKLSEEQRIKIKENLKDTVSFYKKIEKPYKKSAFD